MPKRVRSSFLNKGYILSLSGTRCLILPPLEQVTFDGEIFKIISMTEHELHLEYCRIYDTFDEQKDNIESERNDQLQKYITDKKHLEHDIKRLIANPE
jgi:hypothetical protein